MTRPLRINVEGGWYHITARGDNRERIYDDDRDRRDFLERLEEMTKRFGVEVHAYVLMANHYHLLLRTPQANASAAIQWLNVGYGIWRNRRHQRSGHVFQGRFKSILVEGGAWVLELSLYLHFNPVAVKSLGWDKPARRAEATGATQPPAQTVSRRLETLRTHRWSSYRGYAGYERLPGWVSSEEVLKRIKGGRDGYRALAEERLAQGRAENLWASLKWGAVLGSTSFAERVRPGGRIARETAGRRRLAQRLEWAEIVAAVERVKGERWEDFAQRHGDCGRDLALWLGRRRGGMGLRELGEEAGRMDYSAVSEAIRTFDRKRQMRQDLQEIVRQAAQYLNLEM